MLQCQINPPSYNIFTTIKFRFPKIEAKKKEWEEHQKIKLAAAPAVTSAAASASKPVFKPKIKPPTPPAPTE